MSKEVIIPNQEEFERKKKVFQSLGRERIHIVSDFDRTLTYGTDEHGGKTKTVISRLRSDPKYLGEEYVNKSIKLFEEYHPYEISTEISEEERQKKMHEWWKKHFDLISKCDFNKEIIKQVVNDKPLEFRKGVKSFLEKLYENNVPCIIMSAAPGDMLEKYMEREELFFPNIKILGNRYEFDSSGNAIKIKEPIIHVANKNEISLKEEYEDEVYKKIEKRKNVLLLGDSYGDAEMSKSSSESSKKGETIKIGFLNIKDFSTEENKKRLEEYKKIYDVVLTGDQDFGFVNKSLEDLIS